MTIFVTLQLIVTLDSIRNSCDVLDDISLFFSVFKIVQYVILLINWLTFDSNETRLEVRGAGNRS